MKFPWANIALLVILLTLAVTGYLGLVNGEEDAAWRLWLHGIAAYALVVLFLWKGGIILDAYRRKQKWTRERIVFSILLVLLLLTVLLGLLWTFNGPVYLGGFSLVSLHIYVAIPVMVLVAWHVRRMKFIFRVRGAVNRRLFMGTAVAALAGLLLRRAVHTGKELAHLRGAERRFTGSYERDSYSGRFPSVSWLFDRPKPIDPARWRLQVEGAVARPFELSYHELTALPVATRNVLLDCTSGWYTTQTWEGVPLKALLDRAGLLDSAASVTVEAVSRYQRRFSLPDSDRMLLAYRVAGMPLTHGHGAPLRLVIPGRRGYEWVKWVMRIQINSSSAIWQPPLPLR